MGKKVQSEKERLSYERFKVAQQLNDIKNDTDDTYQDLLDEIAYYQYQMYKTDRKAVRKQRKKAQNNQPAFLTSKSQLNVRREIIQEAGKEGGLFDRLVRYLSSITPFVRYLGQVCAKFICTILQFDVIKQRISKSLLDKIDLVYQVCVNL